MDLLRLVALDQEDLAVLSAHLQDALVRVDVLSRAEPQQRGERGPEEESAAGLLVPVAQETTECGDGRAPRRRRG